MIEQMNLISNPNFWMQVNQTDKRLLALVRRHYTRTRSRFRPSAGGLVTFVGPGEKLCLITPSGDAGFIWRLFMECHRSAPIGVNCSLFRNEGQYLSSRLILEAEEWASQKWPDEHRFYTYVDGRAVRGDGACFKHAGWTKLAERTKTRGLIVLEKRIYREL